MQQLISIGRTLIPLVPVNGLGFWQNIVLVFLALKLEENLDFQHVIFHFQAEHPSNAISIGETQGLCGTHNSSPSVTSCKSTSYGFENTIYEVIINAQYPIIIVIPILTFDCITKVQISCTAAGRKSSPFEYRLASL
jgi:hypothetical protein